MDTWWWSLQHTHKRWQRYPIYIERVDCHYWLVILIFNNQYHATMLICGIRYCTAVTVVILITDFISKTKYTYQRQALHFFMYCTLLSLGIHLWFYVTFFILCHQANAFDKWVSIWNTNQVLKWPCRLKDIFYMWPLTCNLFKKYKKLSLKLDHINNIYKTELQNFTC